MLLELCEKNHDTDLQFFPRKCGESENTVTEMDVERCASHFRVAKRYLEIIKDRPMKTSDGVNGGT